MGFSPHLVSDRPDIERSAARAPALQVIEGDGIPFKREPIEWRYTATGRLLPQTSKRWRRLRMTRQHVTKVWRELSAQLDAATDVLDAANDCDLDGALTEWRRIAARLILTEVRNPHAMRCKVALAAIIANTPFVFGGVTEAETAEQFAFAALDRMALYARLHAEQRAARVKDSK